MSGLNSTSGAEIISPSSTHDPFLGQGITFPDTPISELDMSSSTTTAPPPAVPPPAYNYFQWYTEGLGLLLISIVGKTMYK